MEERTPSANSSGMESPTPPAPAKAQLGKARELLSRVLQLGAEAGTPPRSSGRPERDSRDRLSPSSCLRRRDPVPRNASRPDVGRRLARQPEGAARTSSRLGPCAALQRARGVSGGRAPAWGWGFRGSVSALRGRGKGPGRVPSGHQGRGGRPPGAWQEVTRGVAFGCGPACPRTSLGGTERAYARGRGRSQGAEREGASPHTGRCWDGREDMEELQRRASARVPVQAGAKKLALRKAR